MNDERRVGVALTVKDGDKFNKTLSDVNKSLKITQSEIKLAGSKAKEYGNDTKSLGEKQRALENHTKNLNDKVKLYSESINKNSSNLKINKADLEKLGDEKKDLNSKINEAVKMYGKESDEVKSLQNDLKNVTTQYKAKEQQIKGNINAINKHSAEINKCEAELVQVQGELERTNKALSESSNKWLDTSKKLETAGGKLQGIGDKANSAGNFLLKATAPLVAFGGYSVKVAAEFEKGMDTVQALSGATAEDMVLLTDKAKEMGRETSKSASDSAAGLQYMALAGWDTKEMLDGLEPILRLSEVSGADLGTTSDLVTDSLSALGLTAKDSSRYLDVVAKSQASANTSANQMLEAYIGVGGTMKNLKVPIEESATWIGVLANRGIKGSEAGTSLNSVLVNLMGVSGQAAEGLKELGVSAWDSEGNFKGIEGTLRELDVALQNCSEEQRNMFTAMIGGKTQMDTLNAMISGLNQEYTSLKGTVTDSNGALNEMAAVMQDNTKGNVEILKSNLEALGITFGEKLLPHVNTMIEGLTNLINWFGSLDDETQNQIIKFTAMSVATGGALKVFGSFSKVLGGSLTSLSKFTSKLGDSRVEIDRLDRSTRDLTGNKGLGGFSKSVLSLTKALGPAKLAVAGVAGAVYTLKEANDAQHTTIMTTVDDMSLLERAFTKMLGETRYTKEELEDLGYAYKDFTDVNEETAKKLEVTSDKFRNLKFEIEKVNLDGVISEEEKNSIVTRTNELCTSIITEISSRKAESDSAWREIFNADGIIDEEEQKILNKMQEGYNKEIEAVNTKNNRIVELMSKASGDKQKLTIDEQNELNRLQDELRDISLNSFKLTEEEKIRIQETFNQRAQNMSVDSLSEMLSAQSKKRDEAVNLTSEEYDNRIAALKDGLGKLDGEERARAEQIISNLEEDKKNAVQKEREKYDEYLKLAQDKYPELMENINGYNGEILKAEEKNVKRQVEQMAGKFSEMENVTETGMYRVYDKQADTWKDVYANVDKTTGEIIGLWDTTANTIAGKPGIAKVDEAQGNQKTWDNTKNKWIDVVNYHKNNPAKAKLEEDPTNEQKQKNFKNKYKTAKEEIEKDPAYMKMQEDSGNAQRLADARSAWASFKREVETDPIKSTVVYNHNKVGGATKYATGTSNSAEGFAEVNENGWELMSQSANLFNIAGREYAYLNKGTRVQTHAISVATMKADVQAEVSKQLSKNNDANSIIDKLGKTLTKATGKQVNINVNKMNLIDKKDTEASIFQVKVLADAF